MIRLNVSSLVFDDIKNNLKEYFKKDVKYTDYNFEGSGLSGLLNILAYNTHYSGFYVKMVLNEAFPDTAQARESLISHAKKQGYIVKGKTCSYASVGIEVLGVDPSIKFITVPVNTTFNTASATEAKNVFNTITDYTIKNNNGKFILDNIIIQQGTPVKNVFKVDYPAQRFRLSDVGCDVNTIKVFVKNSETSTIREQYNRVDDIIDIQPDSKVWYVSMASSGVYDIYFGEDKFGVQPFIGKFIEIEFMSTIGTQGNEVNKFTISPVSSTNKNNIGYYTDITVKTIEASHGGVDEETVEALRFAIPNHNRRQKRVVNENDYRSVLINEFRDVESITVWGGEKNSERMYAKMFISIKPYNSDNLSETAKTLIRNNLVKRYGIVGSNIIFVKPEYINLDMTINIKKARLSAIDDDQIKSEITIKSETYNKEVLTKFDEMYSDTDFISYLRKDTDYITSIYTRKIISKRQYFTKGKNTRYRVIMGNPISSIYTENFSYGLYTAYLKSEGNLLYVYDSATDKKLSEFSLGFYDTTTGDIYVDVPRDLYDDSITFICTPLNPDIETYLNNIVRFSKIDVEVTQWLV